VSRRTETSYKAQSPGKLAQHNKALGSGDRVNGAVVQRQLTSLSGEIWPNVASAAAMEVRLRPSPKRLEPPPNPKAAVEARCAATRIDIGQKSAEAIVAQRLE
jgi:hypothetical protein